MKKPNAAMVVSVVALAVALGGTATAARTLIGSKDIAPGAIKARHIAAGAVTGPKLAPGAVTRTRIAPGSVSSTKLAIPSFVGPPGDQGPPGPAGPTGSAGGLDPSRLTMVVGPDVLVPAGQLDFSISANCPSGARPTGGGFFASIALPMRSAPTATGWNVFVWNDKSVDITASAYVICVAP